MMTHMIGLHLLNRIKRGISVFFPTRKTIGGAGANTVIEFPVFISSPKSVFMESDTRLRQGSKLLNAETDKITIKKYTVISMNCMIVTNNHTSTVGIPQILLGISGINDKRHNIVIEEDVWIGANVTILSVDRIGRGAVIGACSTVTKNVPPYALVVGSPARIVGAKFTIDQIIQHEKILYPESERLSRMHLEQLYEKYYVGLKTYGTNTIFDDVKLSRLEYCMKQRRFTDKEYINRLRKSQL